MTATAKRSLTERIVPLDIAEKRFGFPHVGTAIVQLVDGKPNEVIFTLQGVEGWHWIERMSRARAARIVEGLEYLSNGLAIVGDGQLSISPAPQRGADDELTVRAKLRSARDAIEAFEKIYAARPRRGRR